MPSLFIREVYIPRTPNIREDTRRPFNATSINSAADAPLHANDCHPDLGFSMPPQPRIFNASRHGPTHYSLSLRCPARCAMTDRGSVFKVTRRCNGTIPFGLGSTFKVSRRPLATCPPCSALPRGTPSPELGVPSSEFRVPSPTVRTATIPPCTYHMGASRPVVYKIYPCT